MSIPKYIVIPEESQDANLNFMPLNEGDALWHKDDDYTNCELCNKEFTFINRRHHCRNCGKIICDDCSQDYTSKRDRDPDRVCDLCYNCVLNLYGEKSTDCNNYIKYLRQFISPNLSIGGRQIQVGDTLTIINIARNGYYPNAPIFYKAVVVSLDARKGMINLTLTETNDDKLKLVKEVYLQNDDASQQRNDEIPSRIIIYHQSNTDFVDQIGQIMTTPIPLGYVYVTNVTPPVTTPAQGGGYKYRKNKSKRKNKRSVRRLMSKRFNMRRKNKNKKVTKRLRKSRRRARR